MGIPRLTQWLRHNYPDAFGLEADLKAEHVYLDVNCVLHEALTALGGSAAEESFIRHVFQRLDLILEQVHCSASLYLAVDGAAAAAKVAEQRRRRRLRQEVVGPAGGITVNMLTPGVPVMDRLALALLEHLQQLQVEGRLPKDLRISVSGPDEAGEGEHKISLQMLRNESAAEAVGAEECHILVGTDSDLLLVPIALRRGPKRVVVARREDGPVQRKSPLRVCRSDRIVEAMARQFQAFTAEVHASLTPKDLQQLRLDFVLMVLFRGNDYLPALVSRHDPADLWSQYLRWRQNQLGDVGIVQMGDSGEDQEAIVLAPGQLSAFLQAQGSGWLPARLSGIVPKEGVSQYLEALLWCLETYSTGKCPDCQRRFPPHLKEFASASLMVEEMPGLPAECFKARHRDGPPLSPLCCALAALPVADARRVVLPTCPALAPLLQEGGLLGEVAKLESCKECRQLTAAVVGGPVTGKKAAKQRKALEVHKRQHQDVDAVSLEALEAEVRRLCDGAAVPPDATQPELKTVGSATEVAPAPKKGASRQKKRKRG